MLGTLAAGVALLAAFVPIERRVPAPLVDPRMFRNRAFAVIVLAGSLSNIVYCYVAVFSALYLQQARGISPLDSGLIFLALSAGSGGASYYSGRLAEHVPADRVMAIGLLISAIGIIVLTSVDSLWVYTPVFFVCGVGLGLGWALTSVATQAVVPTAMAGTASGIALTSIVMLGAVGVAIGATVLELLSGSAASAASDGDAIQRVLRAGALLALLGAAGLIGLGRAPETRTAEVPA
jgi:sugar phosphate permease